MAIAWTKKFDENDDGAVLTGTQIGQIQDDIDANVASLVVPVPTAGDEGKIITVKDDLTGFELSAPADGAVIASQAEAEAASDNTKVMTPLRVKQEVQKGGAVVIPIANGGTGQVTAQAGIDALLPSQAAASGKVLTSNGSFCSWGSFSSSAALGAWVDKSSSYAAQAATTDGFVVATITYVSGSECRYSIRGYTDANANPTTQRCETDCLYSTAEAHSFTMPVRKGEYWKITLQKTAGNDGVYSVTAYWIPMGS